MENALHKCKKHLWSRASKCFCHSSTAITYYASQMLRWTPWLSSIVFCEHVIIIHSIVLNFVLASLYPLLLELSVLRLFRNFTASFLCSLDHERQSTVHWWRSSTHQLGFQKSQRCQQCEKHSCTWYQWSLSWSHPYSPWGISKHIACCSSHVGWDLQGVPKNSEAPQSYQQVAWAPPHYFAPSPVSPVSALLRFHWFEVGVESLGAIARGR